jgi:RecJ-like exonuclease
MTRKCSCARNYYRNNRDGSQQTTVRGSSRCPKCQGSGFIDTCAACDGAAVVHNAKCRDCWGCGARSQPAPAVTT